MTFKRIKSTRSRSYYQSGLYTIAKPLQGIFWLIRRNGTYVAHHRVLGQARELANLHARGEQLPYGVTNLAGLK